MFMLIKNHLTESANIFTGITTLILGYFTYKSVQTSNKSLKILQNQNDILQKANKIKFIEQKKPLVLEQIRNYYNPLKSDIQSEIEQINLNQIYFNQYSKNKQLVFPIPSSKKFYIENTNSGNAQIYLINYIKSEVLSLSSIRYELYQKIQEEFNKIDSVFKQKEFKLDLYKLIEKNEKYFPGCNDDNPEWEYTPVTFQYYAKNSYNDEGESDPYNGYLEGTIDICSFFKDLKELIILDLFSPIDLQNPENYEFHPSYYNFHNYKNSIPKKITNQFNYNKSVTHKYLNELLEIDNKILNQITTCVNHLVQEYSITMEEM